MAGVVFTSNLNKVRGKLRSGYRRNVTEAVILWERSLKLLLRGNRSGKFYRVPDTNVLYQASAPGEAPASRTGDLRGSYYHTVPSATEGFVGSERETALYLERGTQYMEPRPHIRPALIRREREIKEALTQRVR